MRRLGEFVSRTWWIWIPIWALGLAGSEWLAPPQAEVKTEGEMRHLPYDSSTRRAARLFAAAFPEMRSDSNVVMLFERSDEALSGDDLAAVVTEVMPLIESAAAPYGGIADPSDLERVIDAVDDARDTIHTESAVATVQRIWRAAVAEKEQERATRGTAKPDKEQLDIVNVMAPHNSLEFPLLLSEDGQAMLVVVNLNTSFLTTKNHDFVAAIRGGLLSLQDSGKFPAGLDWHLTGSAVVGRDVVQAVSQSTDAIQSWTWWLVMILLIVVLRSPLVAIIPLITMFCAVQIALNLVQVLAARQWLEFFDGLTVYMTVLVYGASIDYSLFLIARYREELGRGATVKKATTTTVALVGTAVVIAAATEILGIGMLGFSRFGKLRHSGYAIPIGLAFTLLASLTLTFSLLRLVGRRGFWPFVPRQRDNDQTREPDDELERSLSGKVWLWVGRQIERRPRTAWLVTAALLLPLMVVGVLNESNVSYDIVSELPSDMPSRQGNRALQRYFEPGMIAPVTVLLQNESQDYHSQEGIVWLESVTETLRDQRDSLGLADLRSLTDPLGSSARLKERLKGLNLGDSGGLQLLPAGDELVSARQEDGPIASTVEQLVLGLARERYVSSAPGFDGSLARLDLVLADDPFLRSSIQSIPKLRKAVLDAIPEGDRADTKVVLAGATASLHEISEVSRADLWRIYVLATVAVLCVLVALLRRPWLSCYLIVTVIATYLSTLGVTFLVFRAWQGSEFIGLEWSVPILLFTLLMAVGADYNVMLVKRVFEEAKHHAFPEAVSRALAATGGLITGAGIVMAGTFSALIWGGELDGLRQLGFALACGVLIDTFLVRTTLVPAFLLITHSGDGEPTAKASPEPQLERTGGE